MNANLRSLFDAAEELEGEEKYLEAAEHYAAAAEMAGAEKLWSDQAEALISKAMNLSAYFAVNELKPDESVTDALDAAQTAYRVAGDREAAALVLEKLSHEADFLGDIALARESALMAASIWGELERPSEEARTHINLSDMLFATDTNEAEAEIREAMAIYTKMEAVKAGEAYLEIFAENLLDRSDEGDCEAAIRIFRELRDKAVERRDLRLTLKRLVKEAEAAAASGKSAAEVELLRLYVDQCAEDCGTAHDLYEESEAKLSVLAAMLQYCNDGEPEWYEERLIGLDNSRDCELIENILDALAESYEHNDDEDCALRIKALEAGLLERMGDYSCAGSSRLNRAAMLERFGSDAEAVAAEIRKAGDLFKKAHDLHGEIEAYLRMLMLVAEGGDIARAERLGRTVLTKLKDKTDTDSLEDKMFVCMELTRLLMNKKDVKALESANNYARMLCKLAENQDDDYYTQFAESCRSLIEVYLGHKDKAKAIIANDGELLFSEILDEELLFAAASLAKAEIMLRDVAGYGRAESLITEYAEKHSDVDEIASDVNRYLDELQSAADKAFHR